MAVERNQQRPESESAAKSTDSASDFSNDDDYSFELTDTATGLTLPAPNGDAPPSGLPAPLKAPYVLQMQRRHGNQYTQRMVQAMRSQVAPQPNARKAPGGVIQRGRINYVQSNETLYNPNSAGTFSPNEYGNERDSAGNVQTRIKYRMARDRAANTVTVTVKMKFVSQTRDTNPMLPDGVTPNPNFGGYTGTQAAIAPTDERFAWCQNITTNLVTHWNGSGGARRFALVGHRKPTADAGAPAGGTPAPSPAPAPAGATPGAGPAPATPGGSAGPAPAGPAPAGGAPPVAPGAAPAGGPTPAPNEIRLPVTFVAQPVFDLADTDVDSVIRVYGSATTAGTPGNPIDAGNYYMNQGTSYPASPDAIYAHEYGHLIGINDEYSRSNDQMHRLMHGVSPRQSTQMNDQLDRETIKRMILAALRPQLMQNVGRIGNDVSTMFVAQQDTLIRQLATGIRQGWRQQSVVDNMIAQITPQLSAPEKADLLAALPRAVRFEAFQNLSNITYAQEVLPAELSAARIQSILNNAFRQVINDVQSAPAVVTYLNAAGGTETMNVTIQLGSPWTPTAAGSLGGGLDAAATTIGSAAVGQPAPTLPNGRADLPPMQPSGSLLAAISGLPAQWRTAATGLAAFVDQAQMATKIAQALTASLGTVDFSSPSNVAGLYQMLYMAVHNISSTVSQAQIRAFLSAQIMPLVRTQINDLRSMIDAEITRIGNSPTPPPRTGGPDPLRDSVAQMATAMRDRLKAETPTGQTAEPRQGTQNQNVRYTVNSMMGNTNQATDMRPDYLSGIATQFNLPANNLVDDATEQRDFTATTNA
jgi:hypothetical protein